MTSGNGVRDDSQLRDIEELIAKLADVNRQLSLPARVISMSHPAEADEPGGAVTA